MISVDVYGWLFYKENREIKQKDVQTKYTVNTSDCYVAKERARLQFHIDYEKYELEDDNNLAWIDKVEVTP